MTPATKRVKENLKRSEQRAKKREEMTCGGWAFIFLSFTGAKSAVLVADTECRSRFHINASRLVKGNSSNLRQFISANKNPRQTGVG